MIVENGKYYLYRHIRLDKEQVFYIGIGSKPLKKYHSYICIYKRAYSLTNRTKYWRNITNKTEYEVEILFESDDYDFIEQKEIEFIKLYGRRDRNEGTLVNLTDGGSGRRNIEVSKETREKMAERKRGRKLSKRSIELRTITRRLNTKERGYYAPADSVERRNKQRFNTMVPPEKQNRVIELVKEGITLEKIAITVEVHFHTIKKILLMNNIDYKQYRNAKSNNKKAA